MELQSEVQILNSADSEVAFPSLQLAYAVCLTSADFEFRVSECASESEADLFPDL